ncbi:TonB-dependent receptor, partial [Porticoccaceae bacterium]|nr:TonB-dependent receptor [Porticoccaceae bacterium]
TVLSSEAIEKRNLSEISDYANALPGVSLIDSGVGYKRVFIRGLAVLVDRQVMTSTYLGSLPLSSIARGSSVDLKLVDIERIEVLKGPQGTLYGSSAMSGTLRYIPETPDLNNIEGSIDMDIATLAESDDISHSMTGVLNLPLVDDTLALRVAAYQFEDAGYVDVVGSSEMDAIALATGAEVREEKDANSITTKGLRTSLLWQTNDQLRINLTLGTQQQESKGTNLVMTALEPLQTQAMETGKEGRERNVDYANLQINYDLGWASLTSASSMLSVDANESENTHHVFVGIYVPYSAARFDFPGSTDIMTQEIRLASQLEGPWQFVGGLYYEDVELISGYRSTWQGNDDLMSPDAAAAPVPGFYASQTTYTDYQQQAFFGEVSYQFNPTLELTVGGRHFDYDREDEVVPDGKGLYESPASLVDSSEKGQVYKANLSYTPNDDTLLYALWSEGFRLGRGQTLPPASLCDVDNNGLLDHTDAPLKDQLDSDSTENFELGAKFTLLENRLTLKTAVYRTNWKDIVGQTINTTPECHSTIQSNVGEARSDGAEVEISYLMSPALKMDFALAYNDARYTTATSPTVAVGGDLPFSPDITVNLGLEYNFDLSGNPVFIRTDVNYFDEVAYLSSTNSPFPPLNNYTQVSLRAGVTVDQWELAIYGSNLLNENNFITYSESYSDGTYSGSRLRPRKLGLQIKYNF